MKKLMPLLALLSVVPASMCYAQGLQPSAYPTMAPFERYAVEGRANEVALARTAAPPSISANAEVLVLGKHGYEKAANGTNGFVCFVERSWTAGFTDLEFWNPKGRAPNCFNPPAVRSVLPQYLERTKWALSGLSKAAIVERTRAAFATHHFTDPEAGSFSFMLSKRGYLNDSTAGPWYPHVMFFVPHGSAATWGAGLKGSPIIGSDGWSRYEPTVFFIPVRRWSDGSLALPPAGPHQH